MHVHKIFSAKGMFKRLRAIIQMIVSIRSLVFPTKSHTFLFFMLPTIAELSSEPNVEDESGFYKVPQEWSEESYSEEHDSEESWEEEVDNLVAWTDGLDEESLNYENYENYENIDN